MREKQKLYYRCRFTQLSPLRLSGGKNDRTDNDLMLDSRGLPMIPGSALAGVLRGRLPKPQAELLFGRDTVGADMTESAVIVGDATLPADARVRVSYRDGVMLDQNKVAVSKAKYDFEAAECRAPYTAVLEWTGQPGDAAADLLETLLAGAAADGLTFGGRTTRGYGRMAVEVCRKSFRFPAELDAWLHFDPYADDAFADAAPLTGRAAAPQQDVLRAELRMTGSFIVRRYTTEVSPDGSETKPDYCALQNVAGNPVLPGTGWAGAFRHHMLNLLDEMGCPERRDAVNALFGFMGDGTQKRRSALCFDETEITGGQSYTLTRNALDRFSAGTSGGALYTSRVQQGGQGVLTIRLRKGAADAFLLGLLGAALLDLDRGYLTVGGETGVGRGASAVTALTLNGRPLAKETLLNALTEAAK